MLLSGSGNLPRARPARWPQFCALLLVAAAGCHAPPAFYAPVDPCALGKSQNAVLTEQLACDSAVAVGCHPLRTTAELTIGPADHLLTVCRGAIGKRIVMPCLMGTPPEVQPCCARSACGPPDAACHPLACKDDRPATVLFYPDGREAFDTLEHLIDQATCSIDVLMFQWENDCVGAALADRLAARAGPGLRVRVLVDGGGNLIFGAPEEGHSSDVNGVVRRLAQQPYVEVLRTRNAFCRFDHRKLVLIDGRLAWMGGRNFTCKSFFGQHDISFLLQGPLVAELVDCYEHFWCEQGGRPACPVQHAVLQDGGPVAPAGVSPAGGPGVKPASAVTAEAPPCPAPPCVNAQARLVCTGPLQHEIQQALYKAVDSARDHLYLENFTVSDSLLLYKLARARQRGVDVRVVTTVASCTETINRCNKVVANRLLRAGVRVYLYPQMTHTKAAAADGCWVYLGTGNFDALSFRHNREIGIAVSAGPLIGEVEQRLFQADFCPEWELKEPVPVSPCDYAIELISSFCL